MTGSASTNGLMLLIAILLVLAWKTAGYIGADYVLLPQTEHFGDVLVAADIAVSRAGGTVWELAASGTPSILVPYPFATADHQTLNARHFERGGGAIVVPNDDIATVPGLVDELLSDPNRLAAMHAAMLSMARVDAADSIAEGLIELAGR